ncbi:hypothetical protein AAE478_004136 [Parahypoxylon ruwenzoriense]
MDDIAIVGLSFKLPQDAVDESSFWKVLENGRNLMTKWPESRTNLNTFYDPDSSKTNKLHSLGAHFIEEDPGAFDAPFFAITAEEAAAMDPQQRWLLETSYRAFENAGITLNKLKASRTGVFCSSSMSMDYTRMHTKDPDTAPRTAITGTALSMMPNRLSWYFDLVGPSVHIDTACSGSMVAMDLACQSLHSGDSTAALVTGTNFILTPEGAMLLSNLNFLSPDSVCYSFDHRANGYARGEGVICVVLKTVSNAIQDGDVIRAVIRSTGTNQDGKTPSLTQPSSHSQESLIMDVYSKAGLDLDSTRYFEAHGTGTPVGDPIEMRAIGNVFGTHRSNQEPLYVGSVKSNIGHLEGCSGLAGIVKSIMILEKGVIPPNALFERINPSIDIDSYHIKVPTSTIMWPSEGLRRVSVNSFGFGGTNAHIVMDDAYHYLCERGLKANHTTILTLPKLTASGVPFSPSSASSSESSGSVDEETAKSTTSSTSSIQSAPLLLIWTASDEKSLKRTIQQYSTYYESTISGNSESLARLAFTLATRRNHLPWRTFAVVDTSLGSEHQTRGLQVAKASRTLPETRICFIFTGQGVQYVSMGLELLRYPIFEETLRQAEEVLNRLGCPWSIFDEFDNGDHIDRPDYSQPLCTALQIALVELLKSFNIVPSAVIGFSSGEIAAAYTTGALSLASACKASYYRGQLAERLRKASTASPWAMMSVNLPENKVRSYIEAKGLSEVTNSIHIACISSPINCTLSGVESSLDSLKDHLDRDKIFAQKLKTGVGYHSPAMQSLAAEYLSLMGSLESGNSNGFHTIPMVSTITGEIVSSTLLSKPQYWVDNLVSPVRFLEAVQNLIQRTVCISDFVEVGPHGALRRPLQDILSQSTQDTRIHYTSTLQRSRSASEAILESVGNLFIRGHPVTVSPANQIIKGSIIPLVDCPGYDFDHSHKYWAESRLSRDYRLRGATSSEFLGTLVSDWNPLEPRWRNFFSVTSLPWISDHVVSGALLFPATGMLVMAIEAIKQISPENRQISGFYIKRAQFLSAIIIKDSEDKTETVLCLRPVQRPYEKEPTWFDVRIFAYSNDRWSECFQARIQIQYAGTASTLDVDGGLEKQLEDAEILEAYEKATQTCTISVDRQAFYTYFTTNGVKYGEWFQLLEDLRWDGDKVSIARVDLSRPTYQTTDFVHPIILDTALQLLKVQDSKGAAVPTPAQVPSELFDAWISATPWKPPQTSSVRYLTNIRYRPGTEKLEGTIKALADDGSPLCVIQNIVSAPLPSNDDSEIDKKLFYGVEWKPQLSLLDSQQLHDICGAESFTKDETRMEQYRLKLDSILYHIVQQTYRGLSANDLQRVPQYLKRYVSWMEYHLKEFPTWTDDLSDGEIEARLQEVEDLYSSFRIFTAVARNLKSILMGETDPLRVAFDTGLAESLYKEIFDLLCDHRCRAILELISHESPNLRILEVGAGTGGWTRRILDTLRGIEKRTGANNFLKYEYTDISPAFFSKAGEHFSEHGARMSYAVLDLDRDVAAQGFQLESYDLIVAGSVFHATKNLAFTIQNVRKLLKPGGHLINLEVTKPKDISANFGFGLMPGYFVGTEKMRELYPAIAEPVWDQLLRDNGFSGNDLVLRDYQSDVCHVFSLIVSTAKAQAPNVAREHSILLIIDTLSGTQFDLAMALKHALLNHGSYNVDISSLDGAKCIDMTEADVVISLLELSKAFLADISDEAFQSLKYITKQAQKLMWITSTSVDNPEYPSYNLVHGFLRTIRTEEMDKKIVTLAIESERGHAESVETFLKVFKASFEEGSPEVEYIVRDEQILSGRLFRELALNDKVRDLISPQIRNETWLPGPPVRLTVGTSGMIDKLHFIEDIQQVELGSKEVEVETKAWGLNFRDVFLALGRLEGEDIGSDCSGVVTRVGAACKSALQPGDRVCLNSIGCMRTFCRANEADVYKIPDDLSLESAASILTPGTTAYYSLVQVARLQKGEKILIHSASGGTGQMAIWIAKMLGAEIFATVGFEEKKKHLVNNFGIPSDHIFYSRNTSFAQGIKRVTNGYGVDVVLNSLSGDALRASWELVAPFGRFIEIGKADITAGTSLPMASFAKNVTFSAVDLHYIAQKSPSLLRHLCHATMDLLTRGVVQHPKPLHVYPVSDTEQAFRSLQNGKNAGRIVISVNHSDVVPKCIQDRLTWKFDEKSSYLIAGGLGGLGRAIIKWMADKGAKYLILPSRSGPSQSASQVVEELREGGVHVATPKCDVSSITSLSAVLKECGSTMPPIKGCINAAMVLQDAVFSNMTYSQWRQTIQSKVDTTWALHRLLPKSLDFFVLLSSVAGTYGTVAQSNYAAGSTFQDAFARYRVAQGEKAVSFDIGWMRTIGVIAENVSYQQNRKFAADVEQIEEEELLALLDIYCDPSYPRLTTANCQLLMGVPTPESFAARGQSFPAILQRPLFSGFSRLPEGTKRLAGSDEALNPAVLFKQAGSVDERSSIVAKALAAKLARALDIAPEDVEASKHLSNYGVDSLMAVELRNWIRKDFQANVAVFDIMGGTTISTVGALVANRTAIEVK